MSPTYAERRMRELDKEVAGWLSFTVGVIAALAIGLYCNTTLWHHQVAYHQAHPDAGWLVHRGTVTSTREPSFSSGRTLTPGTVSFRDYYGIPRLAPLNFEPYPLSVGTRVEVDVSRNGRIYVPETCNYDPSCGRGNWHGPRATTNRVVLLVMFGGFVLDAALACLLYLALVSLPRIRGRLGVR